MTKYILTCEHGGNNIPAQFVEYFRSHQALLKTHRGYDLEIFEIFSHFSKKVKVPHFSNKISRLLIDVNRSLKSRDLFSEISKNLSETKRELITQRYYLPYRSTVQTLIAKWILEKHIVYHISFHSFTPVLNGILRNADIGFLYDPKNIREKMFCSFWKSELLNENNKLRIRFNYPYLGTSDGFTTFLRKTIGIKNYCGIELEINHKLLTEKTGRKMITELLIKTFNRIRLID